jgi:hypothetical protein
VRILTVRQPWAWAIIHGGKDIENRTRNLAGEYRGPVAIHAGLIYDEDALIWSDTTPIVVDDDGSHREPRGAIIGLVELVDVHGPHVGLRATGRCSAWAEGNAWHLVFANPRPLTKPVPYAGALALRTLSDLDAAYLLEHVAR